MKKIIQRSIAALMGMIMSFSMICCTQISLAYAEDNSTQSEFEIQDGVLVKYNGDSIVDKLVIPEGVTEIAPVALDSVFPTEVVLPESLKKIGLEFSFNRAIQKINVAEDVEVKPGAFWGCDGLRNEDGLVIVNDVVYDAFGVRVNKEGVVTLPKGLKEISTGAFHEVWGVKKVVLPESMRRITTGAFVLCSDLEEIVLNDQLEFIGSVAFGGTSLKSITIPATVTLEKDALKEIVGKCVVYGQSLSEAEKQATEYKLQFVPTNEQLLGDVNGNGQYEAEDALAILKMAVGLQIVYGYSADINTDGQVTADDALRVLQAVVGLEG